MYKNDDTLLLCTKSSCSAAITIPGLPFSAASQSSSTCFSSSWATPWRSNWRITLAFSKLESGTLHGEWLHPISSKIRSLLLAFATPALQTSCSKMLTSTTLKSSRVSKNVQAMTFCTVPSMLNPSTNLVTNCWTGITSCLAAWSGRGLPTQTSQSHSRQSLRSCSKIQVHVCPQALTSSTRSLMSSTYSHLMQVRSQLSKWKNGSCFNRAAKKSEGFLFLANRPPLSSYVKASYDAAGTWNTSQGCRWKYGDRRRRAARTRSTLPPAHLVHVAVLVSTPAGISAPNPLPVDVIVPTPPLKG